MQTKIENIVLKVPLEYSDLSFISLKYEPWSTPRSSGTGLAVFQKLGLKNFSFSFYGPRLWNSLPESLKAAETAHGLKGRIKTYPF